VRRIDSYSTSGRGTLYALRLRLLSNRLGYNRRTMKLAQLCSKCGEQVATGIGICALCGAFAPTDPPRTLSATLNTAAAMHQQHGPDDETSIEQQLQLSKEPIPIHMPMSLVGVSGSSGVMSITSAAPSQG
jgi:hypothetical protein